MPVPMCFAKTNQANNAVIRITAVIVSGLSTLCAYAQSPAELIMQADQLGVTVRRPVDQETTALGAAFLAGLAEGVWTKGDLAARWQLDAEFTPEPERLFTDLAHTSWLRAVERSRGWSSAS